MINHRGHRGHRERLRELAQVSGRLVELARVHAPVVDCSAMSV